MGWGGRAWGLDGVVDLMWVHEVFKGKRKARLLRAWKWNGHEDGLAYH